MTARDRASELRTRISEIKEAQKHEKHAEALEDKRQALESFRSKLQAAVTSAGVLVKNQRLESATLPDPTKLADSLNKVFESFIEDRGSITKGRNFTTLTGHLDTTTKALRGATLAAWKKVVSAAPKINDSLLRQIAELHGQRAAVEQLRNANARLVEASTKPPANQGEWDAYQTLMRLVEEQIKTLNTDHFPQSVLDFCKAAQSSGAPLSMLTREVRAGLEEHGLLDDLRYRFK